MGWGRGRPLKVVSIVDGDLVLHERATPEPAADQVLIAVAGAGLNRADLLQKAGRYPAPPGWPDDVPGLEISGTVAAVGPLVSSFDVGDRVFGIVGGGAHATHALTTQALCAPVPDVLDIVEAGGIPEVFMTAHDALVTRARLHSGERVLIHGVGSGVGTAAVQLVRALGATSVGTARTPEKLEKAKELGLDEGVVASDRMSAEIGEVDVVIDLVGGPYLEVDIEVCKPRGRVVIVGLLAGASARLDLGRVLQGRIEICGTTMRNRPDWDKAQATAAFAAQVVPLLAKGALRPVTDSVLPLESAAEAYDLLASNKTFGKVILAPRSSEG